MIARYKRVHLTALQSRSASSIETGSITFLQDFTKECDDKFIVGLAGIEEAGGKPVRRPRVGLPKEIHRIIELGERIVIAAEVSVASDDHAIGTWS